MKKHLTAFLFLGLFSITMLTGCYVGTVEPPFGKEELTEIPPEYLGLWHCRDGERHYTLELSPAPKFPDGKAFQARLRLLDPPEGEFSDWPPFTGGLFTLSGKRFVVAVPDNETMCRENRYNSAAVFLYPPFFATLELAGTETVPELRFVNFCGEPDNQKRPASPDLRCNSGRNMVFNSTPELRNFLEKGEYSTSKVFKLTRE